MYSRFNYLNMKFCSVCRNMYYITMTDALSEGAATTTKMLSHKCRNCGNEEKNTDSTICVSKTYFKQTDVRVTNVVNEYTHLDPTLPRIKSMKCPNVECETNTALDAPCTDTHRHAPARNSSHHPSGQCVAGGLGQLFRNEVARRHHLPLNVTGTLRLP